MQQSLPQKKLSSDIALQATKQKRPQFERLNFQNMGYLSLYMNLLYCFLSKHGFSAKAHYHINVK